MSETGFYILFGITWLIATAYALSAFRLLVRVRALKADGGAGEAPDPLTHPSEIFGYVVWLVTGRYAGIGDDVVVRWSGVARVLFIAALPLVLAVFAIALTQAGGWAQPT